ncbi:MAG: acyltransferase [Candidatus Homeothermus sp.]|jgi:chloramphenicol O-acetyltransferase|nr:acyltransferase [Candidatus Homeothermus sp.]
MNLLSKYIPVGLRVLFNRYFRYTCEDSYGKGKKIQLFRPLNIDPKYVEIDDFVRIQSDVTLITSEAKLRIKKYSAIGMGCLIIPGSHVPTVGLPQFLSFLHINDIQTGITIEEDCWIGAQATLLSKCNIGRGSIVGACSLVTKDVPPYAVVAGSPAKIIATRFSIEQIVEHEQQLYPESERLSTEKINEIFETHYKGLKSIGTSNISAADLKKLKLAKNEYNMFSNSNT